MRIKRGDTRMVANWKAILENVVGVGTWTLEKWALASTKQKTWNGPNPDKWD